MARSRPLSQGLRWAHSCCRVLKPQKWHSIEGPCARRKGATGRYLRPPVGRHRSRSQSTFGLGFRPRLTSSAPKLGGRDGSSGGSPFELWRLIWGGAQSDIRAKSAEIRSQLCSAIGHEAVPNRLVLAAGPCLMALALVAIKWKPAVSGINMPMNHGCHRPKLAPAGKRDSQKVG